MAEPGVVNLPAAYAFPVAAFAGPRKCCNYRF
ncbi:hypothetical protein ACVIJ6_005903 [Bradyrhizobium sp. USDA 4369]